jgi:ribonuclease VapC
MVVVDTSVIVAILKEEAEASAFVECIESRAGSCISAGSLLECGIVVGSRAGEAGLRVVRELCAGLLLEVVPVDAAQSRLGSEAFLRYGRGLGNRAQLNFGDCFAYALAKTRNLPLLFKGDDFIHTDIVPALPPA